MFNSSHVNIGRASTPRSLFYCLFAPHKCMVLFFTHIPFVVNHSINATPPERLQQHPLLFTTYRSHVLCVKAELRTTFTSWSQNHFVDVSLSLSVTHMHELWIWFTLSYAMMKALLRLAAVRDTKQAGELRGDTVHFIASSSALVLMMQNGSIFWPLTQTATCLLWLYSSKHIAENS